MEDNKEKRVLNIELNDEVKKVSITGKNGEEQVVMRQELNEDDLEQATGGLLERTWYCPNVGCVGKS
jgi:hypothetical protein